MEEEGSDAATAIATPEHLYELEATIQTAAGPLVFSESVDGEERREVRCLVVGGRVVTAAMKLGMLASCCCLEVLAA